MVESSSIIMYAYRRQLLTRDYKVDVLCRFKTEICFRGIFRYFLSMIVEVIVRQIVLYLNHKRFA